jgi:acetyl-CoA C-acetyltransferase
MKRTVIVSAVRTPIGKFLGSLSDFSAPTLGAIAIREALVRGGVDPAAVDEVIIGNVVGAGMGQAPARQAALKAGLPPSVAAVTINKVCGSGLKAVMLAHQAIALGSAEIVVAGGMESMSMAPYLVQGVRKGVTFGEQRMLDSLIHDGLWDSFNNSHMGSFADYTAVKAGISREMQDAFAAESHAKAVAAREALRAEIVPIERTDKRGAVVEVIDSDEGPRSDSTVEALARLKPAFSADGTVTAGNASPLSDGAAALVLMSEESARERGLVPLATISAMGTSGVEPKEVFFAPAVAIEKVLRSLGVSSPKDIDLFEINEAFSAQVLANEQAVGWQRSQLNVHGGAVALGHPIGASGARVLVTLIHALRQRGGGKGIASLCLGGGNAVALAVSAE